MPMFSRVPNEKGTLENMDIAVEIWPLGCIESETRLEVIYPLPFTQHV